MREKITTLLDGFNRDGGILRVGGDGRWLYMLDSKDEGDLSMATREPAPAPGQTAAKGLPAAFAQDADRLARLEREARVLVPSPKVTGIR